MNDSIRHRDGLHRNSTAGHGDPRRVTTWARALAAAVLLDPAALRRTSPTTVLMTRTATPTAPTTAALAALAAVDVAAAALIECGYDESAFLLLALADRPPRASAACTPSVPRQRPTSRLLRRTGGSTGDSAGGWPSGAWS